MTASTVADVLAWYEANEVRSFSPVALTERRRVWKLFRDSYGDRALEECRPFHLLNFIGSQKGAKSNHTRRRIKATVCKPFNAAAQAGLITRNPFAGVRIPDGPCGRDWTADEFRAILKAAPPYFRQLVVFLRFGGARPGEGRNLEWAHLRDEVEAVIQEIHKTSHINSGPRRIHYNHVLVKLLIYLRRHRRHPRLVFVNKFGRPWSIQALTKHLRMIRARVGLAHDVRLHGGRHTFATQALLNDVDIYTLAQLLGHTSIRSTERYLHLLNKRQHLNDAMNRAIGRPPARMAPSAGLAQDQAARRA